MCLSDLGVMVFMFMVLVSVVSFLMSGVVGLFLVLKVMVMGSIFLCNL